MRLFLLIAFLFFPALSNASDFHTLPYRWDEPRVFHRELSEEDRGIFKKNVKILRVKKETYLDEEVNFSLNGAYWYVVREHEDKMKCLTALISCAIKMHVFNERDYLMEFSFDNTFKNSSLMVQWINEKLLYIEVWWDKESGIYLVYDVEKEKILAEEAVFEGSKVFEEIND